MWKHETAGCRGPGCIQEASTNVPAATKRPWEHAKHTTCFIAEGRDRQRPCHTCMAECEWSTGAGTGAADS
eukprot:764790-Hanusia_phi.AAC.3